MQLKDKKILLSGASGGIGMAIARALDLQGCRLILHGRKREKLVALQQSLRPGHKILCADLNSGSGRNTIVANCEQSEIDIFISATGVMDFKWFEDQADSAIEQMLQTNLLGPILLTRQLIPLLRSRPQAMIVHIGSTFGSIGHPGFAAYCASKFGLRGFNEALRRELADSHIKVAYLAPRATQTELNSNAVNALNKALGNATDSPDQVAEALLKLLKLKGKHAYIGWPEKLFVPINSLFPALVNNALFKKLPLIRQHAGK